MVKKKKYNIDMARKSLFDIIDEFEVSPARAFSRILYFFDGKTYTTTYSNYGHTLKYYINNYLFGSLPIRKAGESNIDELLCDIDLSLHGNNKKTFDDVFLLIELIVCCFDSYSRCNIKYFFVDEKNGRSIFNETMQCVNEILLATNHELVETKRGRIVIQSDSVMEQAVFATEDEELSVLLYKYRHYSNNISDKKQILVQIINKLEPRIQQKKNSKSHDRYYETADTINNIANNFNVRHNNTSGSKKKSYACELTEEEQEYWYDQLYNAILIMILEDDFLGAKNKLESVQKNKVSE